MHKIIESNANTTQSQNMIGGVFYWDGGIFMLFIIFFIKTQTFFIGKSYAVTQMDYMQRIHDSFGQIKNWINRKIL